MIDSRRRTPVVSGASGSSKTGTGAAKNVPAHILLLATVPVFFLPATGLKGKSLSDEQAKNKQSV